jgi:hypothetical protein
LREDPLETQNTAERHPEELLRHQMFLARYRDGSEEPSVPSDAAQPTVEPQTLERLRALGYLE